MNKLILILLLAAGLRFWQLGAIPKGITHDEMGYIYNAYTIATTGKNVFSQSYPLFTWMTENGFPFMPVPIYSMVPLFWIAPLSPFIARFLPAAIGVLDVGLLYFIVRILFKRTDLALLSALFLAISPWHLHFARSAYDANFALFFYLVAILLYIKRKFTLSILAFLLAIFSYRGMSMLFFPILLLLYWFDHKKHRLVLAGLLFCILLLFLAIRSNGPGFTAESAQLFNNQAMQSAIDTQIREAKGPLIVRRIFANKPIYIVNKFRENYIKAYSPEFLFLYTEPSAIYSIWSRGRIYFIDAVFIIFGCIFLFRLNKKAAYVWTGFFLIGGIPGGIGGLPYSSRNFFLSAMYPVLSAAGALYLYTLSSKAIIQKAIALCIVLLYSWALGSYLHDYYNRYAFYGAEGWAKSIKDISLLADEKKNTYDTVVLGRTSFADAVEYGFWTNIDPKKIQETWKNRQTEPFRYFQVDNIYFSEKCVDANDMKHPLLSSSTSIYYVTSYVCNNDATPSGTLRDYNGNTLWKIFELKIQ